MPTPVTAERHCPKCGLTTADALCPVDGIATILRTAVDTSDSLVKPGDVVAGRYRITGLLGRGGFGAVCAAEHTGTGQAVALKYLTIDPGATDDDVVKRFFQEARVTSSLRHANTVRVFDFGQSDNGALFMAMELLHGPTLEKVLRDLNARGQAMTEAQALDVGIPILRALGEAHGAELVHRDLKPANIMLAEVPNDDPIVKVLDFGIARAKDSSLTGGNKALGTPAYMSPEQCKGGALDGRSDLYALGVILFRCVTGRTPYVDDNPLSLMYMHANADIPDVRHHARSPVSDDFAEIVRRALAKRPEQRFADAKAMRLALEGLRGGAWAGTPQASATLVVDGGAGTDGATATLTATPGTMPLTAATVALAGEPDRDAPTVAVSGVTPGPLTAGLGPALGAGVGPAGGTMAIDLPAAARPARAGLWLGLGLALAALAVGVVLLSGDPGPAPVPHAVPAAAAPAVLAAPAPAAAVPSPQPQSPPAPAAAAPDPAAASAAEPTRAPAMVAAPPAEPPAAAAAGARKAPTRRGPARRNPSASTPHDFVPPP